MDTKLFENAFFYGTQFYRPPNPPSAQRARDLENVKSLGFNVIKIFAEWNWINHHEGVYDFGELIEIAQQAEQLDIAIVVNTRLEQAPYWLVEKYPDSLYVNARGRQIEIQTRGNTPTGGWPGVCLDHSGAREEAGRFLKEIAQALGGYESVQIFDCWNEPYIEPMDFSDRASLGDVLFCYCPSTVAKYREWLKSEYGSIGRINATWFRRYRDFNDINPPRRLMDYVDMMQWRTFMSWSMAEQMSWRCATLKGCLPEGKRVMSHTALFGAVSGFGLHGCDEHQMSKDLDLFGISCFPLWAESDAYAVYRDVGITRNMARGKKCLNLELQGGVVVSSPTGLSRSKTPRRNDLRLWNFCDVACGMKGIMYWHYRSEMLGWEAPGFGLVKRDGGFTERSDEASKLCRFFNRHQRLFNNCVVENDTAAILVNKDSYYLNFASEGQETYSTISAQGMHRFLLRHGIAADFLYEEMFERELSRYKVAYLLLPLVISEDTAAILREYVGNGGVLISDCGVGSFSRWGVASEVIPSCGLDGLFGAVQEDFRQFDFQNREEIPADSFAVLKGQRPETEPPVYLNGSNALADQRVKMTTFLECYALKGATPLLEYEGRIAGTMNSFGKGRAYLFGTALGQSLYFRDQDTESALLKILQSEGIDTTYRNELIIRDLRHDGEGAVVLISPGKQKVSGSFSFAEDVRIIESYDADFRYTLSGGTLDFEINPEDANCIVYAYR